MREAWEDVRLLETDQYLGAESWMQIVQRRSNWLYGRAHSPSGMFLQRTGETTTSVTTVWEGTTYYRAEHPTLNFSARINLAAGGAQGTRLQYYAADTTWKDIDTDATTGDAWFNATENNQYDLEALNIDDDLPADGYLRLRFVVDGTGGSSSGDVYRAFMSGTTGFTSWASLADWADTDVPTAAQLNNIRQSQAHLLDCAERPNLCQNLGEFYHNQPSSPQAVARYAFRYDGRNRLYTYLWTSGFDDADEHVILYVCNEKYPASGARLSTLQDFTGGTDLNDGYNYDLSGLGLTVGDYYQIEVVITNVADGGPHLRLGGMLLTDVGSPARTYVPGTFAHADVLTHTHLNNISDDLEQMYSGTAGAESPIYSEHWLSTHQPTAHNVHYIINSRIRIAHSWRWLRYASDGAVPLYVTDDGSSTLVTLPDTDGEPALYDTWSISGLTYGQEYYIADAGDNRILWAYEDYED